MSHHALLVLFVGFLDLEGCLFGFGSRSDYVARAGLELAIKTKLLLKSHDPPASPS